MVSKTSRSSNLQFLKLGGSLITDKSIPSTPRLDVIARLAAEIAAVKEKEPNLQIILGHGSGSFGHVPAKKYGTRNGVKTMQQWSGFTQVWWQATSLNRLVIEALQNAGILAIAFPASAGAITKSGRLTNWNITPLLAALEAGMLPVVFGDVAFDNQIGGTILSTEDIFEYLAAKLNPSRVLLAGLEQGVYSDYPERTNLIPTISPQNIDEISAFLGGSAATDVTGGMDSKVNQMLNLVEKFPFTQVCIFSGNEADNVKNALLGDHLGTHIKSSK
ncbi:MAG: isopentenyl phosphate kinase [Chloroflexota bacterium]